MSDSEEPHFASRPNTEMSDSDKVTERKSMWDMRMVRELLKGTICSDSPLSQLRSDASMLQWILELAYKNEVHPSLLAIKDLVVTQPAKCPLRAAGHAVEAPLHIRRIEPG